MPKQILFKDAARKKIMAGVEKLAIIVGSTLGPKGKAVIINKGEPIFTRDGVTVAKDIILPDNVENMGADLVREVAGKSNDEAGDGTTTATILCHSLMSEGLKGVMAGIDPLRIKKGMEEGAKIVIDSLKKISKPIKSITDMEHVAAISSRDPKIGEIIASIYDKIGKDGNIAVEEMKSVGMDSRLAPGMEYDSGWIAPHFVTNVERRVAEVEDPYILVTTQVLSRNQDILEILEAVARTDKKSLVVVADDISGEALATFVINKLRGVMKVLAIKAAGYGNNKKEFLQDIAAVTGAKLISEETGTKVENATLDDLGKCGKVEAYQKSCYFIDGKGKKSEIEDRAKTIKAMLQDKKLSEVAKETLEKRYAKMTGGIGIIMVGCATEKATHEVHYRLEDAIKATKAALEEGIVIGAGMALVRAAKGLESRLKAEKDISIRYGIETLHKAILKPSSDIIDNTGGKSDVILERVSGYAENPNMGYDANRGEIVDLLQAGIIDPHKVVRVALEGAVEVAGLFLITSAIIADEPEKENGNDNANVKSNKK